MAVALRQRLMLATVAPVAESCMSCASAALPAQHHQPPSRSATVAGHSPGSGRDRDVGAHGTHRCATPFAALTTAYPTPHTAPAV